MEVGFDDWNRFGQESLWMVGLALDGFSNLEYCEYDRNGWVELSKNTVPTHLHSWDPCFLCVEIYYAQCCAFRIALCPYSAA